MKDFSGKSPSPLSDDHLRAIGAVIANWNALELVMALLALGFYKIPPTRGLVFTNNLSFPNKLTILRMAGSNGAITDEVQKRDFIAFLQRIEDASKKRNEIAHGWWAAGNAQGLAKRLSIRLSKRKLFTASEQVPLADLEAIANEFLKLHGELSAWLRTFGVSSDLPDADTDERNPK